MKLIKDKTYQSTMAMVRETSSEEYADAFEAKLRRTQFVTWLSVQRNVKGFSQADVAKAIKCSQSKISKIEASEDAELSLGDVTSYLDALGYKLKMVVVPKEATLVDEVKYHAFSIKRIMDQLVNLAQGDATLARGVLQFIGEAALNIMRLLQRSVSQINVPQPSTAPITVESTEDRDLSSDRDETPQLVV